MRTLQAALSRMEAHRARSADGPTQDGPKVSVKQLFLPAMEPPKRAMPNHLARSSLFAPIAKRQRTFHRETTLVSRSDAVITYTGEQLDEADADLCLQLIFEARLFPLGQPVTLVRSALLKSMGRCVGKHDYEWLHRRMKALTAATLYLEAKKPDGSTRYVVGKTDAFHILTSFKYDDDSERYTFTLDRQWVTLFSRSEFALLDWEKRLQIKRGKDMAKAIQRLVATSAELRQRYALDWLKERLQYTSPIRKFREALRLAMAELERVEIIAAGSIEMSTKGKEQAVWTRLPTGTKQRGDDARLEKSVHPQNAQVLLFTECQQTAGAAAQT